MKPGVIFRLGTGFRPIYLREALVEIDQPNYRYQQALVNILELPNNGNRDGRFKVGGQAIIPYSLIPREIRETVTA